MNFGTPALFPTVTGRFEYITWTRYATGSVATHVLIVFLSPLMCRSPRKDRADVQVSPFRTKSLLAEKYFLSIGCVRQMVSSIRKFHVNPKQYTKASVGT